jgi:hypothetical protein
MKILTVNLDLATFSTMKQFSRATLLSSTRQSRNITSRLAQNAVVARSSVPLQASTGKFGISPSFRTSFWSNPLGHFSSGIAGLGKSTVCIVQRFAPYNWMNVVHITYILWFPI